LSNLTLPPSDAKKQVDYIKEQGSLHEVSAKNIIGGDAINLNDLATNFPTYDIASSTELASVKSHMHIGTEPTSQDINLYVHDFNHMLGWGRDYVNRLDPIQQDAKNIAEIRGRGAPIPEIIKNADQQEIGEYLKHNSVLRIPDDHVESVQKALEAKILEFPENYFLDANPTNEQIQSVLNRVKGTGLTSAQTLDQLVQDGSPTNSINQENAQNVTEEISLDSTHKLSETEITQSAGEIAGNVTAGPTGGAVGEVAGEAAGKAQSEALESVGQSTENPTEAVKHANSESSAADTSEPDEEQKYGYGLGY
jgi:hypothetical protein